MDDLLEAEDLTCGGDGELSEPSTDEQQTIGGEQFNSAVWFELYLDDVGTEVGSCGVPGSTKVFVSKVGLSSIDGDESGYEVDLELRSNSKQGKVLWSSELEADAKAKNISAELSGTTRLYFVVNWIVRDLPEIDIGALTPLLVFGDPKFK